MNAEKTRLQEDVAKEKHWRKWGPYLTERQWATVREDYSENGNAWQYLTHDMARSKAYRWGEEGIGGISDDKQYLCFALGFWNGKDAILKERMFGLTGYEGNHGEDCKEHYYYLDSTPTHSYMKMLYKYPQAAFPYSQLVEENHRRTKADPEYELIDTGVFDNDRYFDIFMEYAKADDRDMLVRVTVHNLGSEAATLDVLPQVWFRNIWSWKSGTQRPELSHVADGVVQLDHERLGKYYFYAEQPQEMLFCENETNTQRLYGYPTPGTYKDGIHEYVVNKKPEALNANRRGTKAAARFSLTVAPGEKRTIRLRLANAFQIAPFKNFDDVFTQRLREADEFYSDLQEQIKDEDDRNIQRQAFAGMLWSKQYYYYDVAKWIRGDDGQPAPASRKLGRNREWMHLRNSDIISMPDKWEYPWYAAWDLAFHTIPLAVVDADFAKNQLLLFTKEWYMHPNGQLPAYEWALSDVNPPVHAWATYRVYKIDEKRNGKSDRVFLEEVFHKLLLNFTWWVNKKDNEGNNIFQGGFLGMDNIGVFDRNTKLPGGEYLEQSDGTSWMAMYTLNMLRMSLELAKENPVYQSLATKFFEHFLYIAGAMANIGGEGINLWDDEDEFFYDVLNTSDNQYKRLKVRSMVGLIPLFAVEILDEEIFESNPQFRERLDWFLQHRSDLAGLISRWVERGRKERHLLSLLRGHRMKRILKRMLDETEFLSPYGIRALSKVYDAKPYTFRTNDTDLKVKYIPAESDSNMFGGNSNWRGPIWFPVNYLLIESLQRFYQYYGDDFTIEHPTGSGRMRTLQEIADDLSERLVRIFRKDASGKRPVYGHHPKLQSDPNFADYIYFYEYFHGDNGRGIGATHQTGWTGLVAKLIQPKA
jgi:hypothetical protein